MSMRLHIFNSRISRLALSNIETIDYDHCSSVHLSDRYIFSAILFCTNISNSQSKLCPSVAEVASVENFPFAYVTNRLALALAAIADEN